MSSDQGSMRADPTATEHGQTASRPAELTVVVQSDIRPWRYPPRMDFQYGDWWRAEFEAGELEPWTSRTPISRRITMVLHADSPLLGYRPARLSTRSRVTTTSGRWPGASLSFAQTSTPTRATSS